MKVGMKIQKLPLLIVLIIIMIECRSVCCDDMYMYYLYKTKNDYSKNVMITFSGNGKIQGNYYYNPKIFANQYESRGCCGYGPYNSAFLSITIDEWNALYKDVQPIVDSLYDKIIDMDPFIEFYEWENYPSNNSSGIDTVKINEIIRKGELRKYTKRVK